MFDKNVVDQSNHDNQQGLHGEVAPGAPSCGGQAPSRNGRLDDRQLSAYVEQEVTAKRAELVTQIGDQDLGIMTEHNAWLGLELLRRFGQRQGRGIETVFKIKQQFYKFAATTVPVNFGHYLIFPLELA